MGKKKKKGVWDGFGRRAARPEAPEAVHNREHRHHDVLVLLGVVRAQPSLCKGGASLTMGGEGVGLLPWAAC